jgi:nucleotide-binding universal stress UspA family protein
VAAADAILQAALRLDVDVVAMASHGRSGLARLALGSTSEEVARRCDRPVLIVHQRKPR